MSTAHELVFNKQDKFAAILEGVRTRREEGGGAAR